MAQNKSFKIYKILLLEDDPDSAEIVTRSLEKYNIQIDHVNNARLAINKLKTKYDLIISDVMMPVMDGFSFIEKYKQEIHNTPVIIVTALKEKEDILKAASLRISHYLIKPFEQSKLVAKVIEALGINNTDLISKKDFPFSISHDVIDESSIKLILKGISNPLQFKNSLANYIVELKSYSSNIKNFTIFVSNEFSYTLNSIELVDYLLGSVMEEFKVKENKLLLKGEYFSKLTEEDISKTKILKLVIPIPK